MKKKTAFILASLATLALSVSTAALAQTAAQSYPNKPIRLIVPFPAGGATDILARAVSTKMADKLGASIVIDNKPGAGGTIGAELAAKATGDGYTLLLTSSSTHSIAPTLNPRLGYNADSDFTPIANVASSPGLFLVPLSSPAKNIAEFIAHAKKNPGKLNYASSGNGTILNLQSELFKAMSGTFITHIPYRGTALAMPDLISGKIDLLIDVLPAALPHIQNGKVKALAVSSAKRSSLVPDIPTVDETLKGYVTDAWFGLFAPKGLPTDIQTKLNTALNESLQDAEVKARLQRLGADAIGGSAQTFAAAVKTEREMWRKIINERKITAD